MLFSRLKRAMAVLAALALVFGLAGCETESSDDPDRTFAEFAAQWVPDDGCDFVIESSDAGTTPDACYPSLEGTPFAGWDAFEKLAKTYIGTYLDNDDRRIEITCRPGGDDWVAPHKIEIDDPSLADPCEYSWRMPVWVENVDGRTEATITVYVGEWDDSPLAGVRVVKLTFGVAGQYYDASHEFGEYPTAWRFWEPDPDECWVKID